MRQRDPWMLAALAMIGGCACGGPRQRTRPAPSQPAHELNVVLTAQPLDPAASRGQPRAQSTAPAPSAEGVEFYVRKQPPEPFRCDADLGEWGSLVPNSGGLPSHVAISFTGTELYVAGDVKSSARGLWLDWVFPNQGFPAPVRYDHGSGGIAHLHCDVVVARKQIVQGGGRAGFTHGELGVLASAQPDCRKLMRRIDAMADAYFRSFRKLYRVDAAGVRWLNHEHALEPVAGAQVRSMRRGDRIHFELVLPNLALPRASETPARTAELGVSEAAEASPPTRDGGGRATLDLGEVRFEPGAALREIFPHPEPISGNVPVAYSYQPGVNAAFEEVSQCEQDGLPSVCRRHGLLTKPGGTKLGNVEIFPGDRGNVLVVGGTPKQRIEGQVVARASELQVFKQQLSFDDDGALKFRSQWLVTRVDADGNVISFGLPPLVCDPDAPTTNCCHPSVRRGKRCEPNPFHNADYSEIGVRGRGWFGDREVSEVRWTWDAAKKQYVVTTLP